MHYKLLAKSTKIIKFLRRSTLNDFNKLKNNPGAQYDLVYKPFPKSVPLSKWLFRFKLKPNWFGKL